MIYFMQVGTAGPVKIGFCDAKDAIEGRRKQLQVGHFEELRLLYAYEGSREDEADLHEFFAAERIRGEWFRPTERLTGSIASPMFVRELIERVRNRRRWQEWGVLDLAGHLTVFGESYLESLEALADPDSMAQWVTDATPLVASRPHSTVPQ